MKVLLGLLKGFISSPPGASISMEGHPRAHIHLVPLPTCSPTEDNSQNRSRKAVLSLAYPASPR